MVSLRPDTSTRCAAVIAGGSYLTLVSVRFVDDPWAYGSGVPFGRRNLSPWASWMVKLGAVERPTRCPAGPADAVAAWRAQTSRTLDELLGPWPDRCPPDVEVLSETDVGPYLRREIVFDSEPTMSVPATVLIPHDTSLAGVEPGASGWPAVLAVHGHGPGRTEICEPEPGGNFAHQLAVAGFVVLAPDLRGFGERAESTWNATDWCDLNWVSATLFGVSPLTQNLWDLRCALDVLGGLREVDADRVGACGFSYGATCALFLAAVDQRVRAAVVSGYFSSVASSHRIPSNLCGSQVLPGMLGRIEHGDLGALIMPRPLFVESCQDDVLFPASAAADEVAHLHQLGMDLEHRVHPGDHHWVGDGVVEFFARTLNRTR